MGCSIKVMYGNVEDVFNRLMEEYLIHSVYCNEDYEPIAIERDANISKLLQQKGRQFFSYKDQVVLAKDEVLKDNHSPYTVFTPYMKKYKNSSE
jgi:deoxyribodipyrimidine photo-lyase